jgi:hypothetical protein
MLEGSQLNANAFGGPGGNITIQAGVFLSDPVSRITASSEEDVPGEINIQAAITNISGLVTPYRRTLPRSARCCMIPVRPACTRAP